MKNPFARQPLRIVIAAVLVVLVGLSLAAVGIASTVFLNRYLIGREDSALTDTARQFADRPPVDEVRGGGPDNDNDAGGPRRFFVQYVSADGQKKFLASNPSPGNQPQLPDWTLDQARAAIGEPTTVAGTTTTWRVATAELRGGIGYVVVGTSLADIEATVRQLAVLELVIGLIAMVIVALLGYWLVRVTLRPLAEVESTAADIAATAASGELSQRVPVTNENSEVGKLATSFNTMVDAIEVSFAAQQESEAEARASEERMRRFVADASHELRTPLTTVRGFAELYSQGAVPPGEVGDVMRRIEDAASRMGLLVEDLLLLARLDQQRPIEHADVDLVPLMQESVASLRAAHPERSVELLLSDNDAPILVTGDASRLRQVVDNLLSNAARHTPASSGIRVGLTAEGSSAVITVHDDGPGMTPEVAARAFERFYRADESRSRDSGGSGLGLAIVRSLVAAHGGEISLETSPESGSTFTIRLQLTGASQDRPSLTPGPWATVET